MSGSVEKVWRDRTNRIRLRAKADGIAFNLPNDYLAELWRQQSGICFYTDVPMTLEYGMRQRLETPSVDRLDFTRGYVVGNVVLCTSRANSIKYNQTLSELADWMPTWHARALAHLTTEEAA